MHVHVRSTYRYIHTCIHILLRQLIKLVRAIFAMQHTSSWLANSIRSIQMTLLRNANARTRSCGIWRSDCMYLLYSTQVVVSEKYWTVQYMDPSSSRLTRVFTKCTVGFHALDILGLKDAIGSAEASGSGQCDDDRGCLLQCRQLRYPNRRLSPKRADNYYDTSVHVSFTIVEGERI